MYYFHSQLYQDSWMIWPGQFVCFQLLFYLIKILSLYISCIWFYFRLLLVQIVIKYFSVFQSYLSLFVWFGQWLIYRVQFILSLIFSTYFNKTRNINFYKISNSWSPVVPCKWTDTKQQNIPFSQLHISDWQEAFHMKDCPNFCELSLSRYNWSLKYFAPLREKCR